MSKEFIFASFTIVFLYGGVRELFRIKSGSQKWIGNLPLDKKLLYVFGRSAFIYAGFLLIQLELYNQVAFIETWRKIYLYISIIISDELGSYIYTKTSIKPKEYALAAMFPGFLVIVIFFFLQILIRLV